MENNMVLYVFITKVSGNIKTHTEFRMPSTDPQWLVHMTEEYRLSDEVIGFRFDEEASAFRKVVHGKEGRFMETTFPTEPDSKAYRAVAFLQYHSENELTFLDPKTILSIHVGLSAEETDKVENFVRTGLSNVLEQKDAIQTVRDLYRSMPDNAAYACLGKWYYNWNPSEVQEEERQRCRSIVDALADLGYQLQDPEDAGQYNDVQGYMGCRIVRIEE